MQFSKDEYAKGIGLMDLASHISTSYETVCWITHSF